MSGDIIIQSAENEVFLQVNYQRTLNGIWNETGQEVVDGIPVEYSWGKATKDQECVAIDVSAIRPFIIAPGERLFITSIDFSMAKQNELTLLLNESSGQARGKLQVRIRGERAILFTELEGDFGWSLNCSHSYYKVSGPGID